MCSVPGLPEVGSNITVHITRVNLNRHSVLVEFGGHLNHGPGASEVYQQVKEEAEVKNQQQDHFEGKPGLVCFMYDDKAWHRARILSRCEHEYSVFLIDKGVFCWASRSLLAKCPGKLLSVPPTAELCVLSNVSSLCVETGWSPAASEFLRSLCGKHISGCVQDVMMPYRILVFDIPSVSKQMCELGFAKKISNEDFKSLVKRSLRSPDRNASIQTDLMTTRAQERANDPDRLQQYLYPELLPGTIEMVTVTHVVHPLKIFCTLHVFSQELKKLSDQLQEYHEEVLPSLMSQPLSDGSPCATKGSDGKWYRSVLPKTTVSGVVKVFHVDYGIRDFVKLCHIRRLPSRFFQLPVVTYECSLYGIVDKGIGWRTDQIDFLKSIILDRIFIGRFEQRSQHEGVYHVTLYGNDNVNVNNIFGLKEDCLSVAERMCADKTIETLNNVSCSCVHDGVSVCTTSTASRDSPENFTMCSRTDAHLETTGAMKQHRTVPAVSLTQRHGYNVSPPKIQVGTKEKVWITCVKSVNQFYGHFAQNTDKVLKMTRDIQRLCRKRTQTKFSVSPKMICFAKYTDGQWHRGQIESTHPKILVHLVDYGDVLELDKSEILPLTPEAGAIASVPMQAVEFELFNVTLPESCDLNEWFENSVTDRVFNVTVMKRDPLGKLSVEMYDEKSNLNLKLKDRWNKTTRPKQGCNINKGLEKTRARKLFSEGVQSRGPRERVSTTTEAHEKICSKQVVQSALEQNSNFRPVNVNAAGHSRTGRNVLLHQTDKQQKAMCRNPKLTALPTRSLDEGYVSEVYLSHCNSPSSFFVHLTSEEDEIFSLQNELNSQSSSVQVDLRVLQPGDIVRAEYPVDGVWYRAVVQNKEGDEVQVQFIDFGNEAILPPPNIRQLDEQFLNTPGHSIHCSLEGDTVGDWTKEQIKAFEKAAGENGEKKILCKFIRKDVSAWLVRLEHKGVVLKAQTDSQMLGTDDTQPLTFKEPVVTEGQTVEAYASSICGPAYFWCQFKNSTELDRISLIAQEIGNAVQTKQIPLDQLCPGVPCLARFSDKLWYRAQVIKKLDNMLSVLFIDYGNESEIDLNSVKFLSSELLDEPPQAFLCQLGGFGSVRGFWNDAADDKFFELLVDEPLNVTIQSMVMTSDVPKRPQYNVLIEGKGLVVNNLMKPYWCDLKPQIEMNQCGLEDQSSTGPTSANDDVNTLTVPKVPPAEHLPKASDLPPRVIKPGVTSEVYISHISSLRSFFVQLAEDEDTLFSLNEQLNSPQISDKDVIQPNGVRQGRLVKAVFPEDNCWYRAAVKEVTENGTIQVEFIDFGNEATVSPPNICRLDEGLLSYPRFSIRCSSNIEEEFKIQKELKDEVFLFKNIFGEVGENKQSCKFIREDGGTWAVKMMLKGSTPDTLLCEKWDDSNLDALQICSANRALTHADVSTPVETFHLRFKKPDVSLGQMVEAFTSCIVGPDYFWCQFANFEQLDQISLIAQEYGNSSEMKPIQMDELAPGSLCLARFSDDLMWYRAQVIKKCQTTISVLFVDYGNESEVMESSVKALPCALLERPPQAFLCLLEGFAQSEGSWDNIAADHFHELLVDKPLKVTVNHIKDTADYSSPPYCVKIETQQCLVNEVMRNFWSVSLRQDQNSAEVFVSCENSVGTSGEEHVSEENQTSETHCAPLLGATKQGLEVTDGDLHEVSDNKVDGPLDGSDMMATITNDDVIANGLALLENHSGVHESDDVLPSVPVEQRLLHIQDSREDAEDARSEKDPLEAQSRCATWADSLENQMLPKTCGDALCDSTCVTK